MPRNVPPHHATTWDAWRYPVMAQLLRYDQKIRGRDLLALSRPGLELRQSQDCIVTDMSTLDERTTSISLCSVQASGPMHLKLVMPQHAVEGNRYLTVYPHMAWEDQATRVKTMEPMMLPDVRHTLERMIHVVTHGLPWRDTPFWDDALMAELRELLPEEIDFMQWTRFIETWGSTSLKEGLRALNTLTDDPDNDPGAWRDALWGCWSMGQNQIEGLHLPEATEKNL